MCRFLLVVAFMALFLPCSKRWWLQCATPRLLGRFVVSGRSPFANFNFFFVFSLGQPGGGGAQMMVAMKRVKWDGTTTGSRLAASVAKVHDELKARLLFKARYLIPCSLCGLNTKVGRGVHGRARYVVASGWTTLVPYHVPGI